MTEPSKPEEQPEPSSAALPLTTTPTITVSEHLHRQLQVLVDPAVQRGVKKAHLESNLAPHVREPADAYICLSENVHQATLPPLAHWNTVFRKAYTILFWIRPRLEEDGATSTNQTNNSSSSQQQQPNLQQAVQSQDEEDDEEDGSEHSRSNIKRVLYRFSTSAEDSRGTGICVTCSPWKIVGVEEDDDDDKDDGAGSQPSRRKPRQLETTLTAFALPHNNPSKLGVHPPHSSGGFLRSNSKTLHNKPGSSGGTPYASWAQQTLQLTENQWHLVACTHVYPYLKRPVWSVCVDGAVLGTGPTELHYPVLNETSKSTSNFETYSNNKTRSMDYCTCLQNITAGGAIVPVSELSADKMDDQKTASQLQAEAALDIASPTVPLLLDVAAVSLYAEAISPTIQAVLAEAGPATAQQKDGRIVVTLPPVANWSKGCSLQSGPKVGIPLTVHGTALELQQLVDRVQFAASAVTARVLGSSQHSSRLCCPFQPVPGKTDITPRVGLVQPDPVIHRLAADELPVLYVNGHCHIRHGLREYLEQQQQQTANDVVFDPKQQQFTTPNWSVAWAEQQAVSVTVLPFFLALHPPVVVGEPKKKSSPMQQLLTDSYRHLYALYSHGGAYAAALIRFLAALIRTGGARVHEEVLQNGTLHILASSLRLGLIRASKAKLFKQQDGSTVTEEDFLRRVLQRQEDGGSGGGPTTVTSSSSATVSSSTTISPSHIPPAIAGAVVELLDVCCGPKADKLEDLPPAMQIRRTSDLALTTLFGLALGDFDLWGGDVVAAATVWKGVAARYGGLCITTGYVVRSQVSVQHFLDRIRLLRMETSSTTTSTPEKREAMETVANSLSRVLRSMLLSSLSNHRSITQAEKDVTACISALSDCPLGSVTSHVVLTAIVGVLTWCEILPVEALLSHTEVSDNEETKIEVATRLGRNILMAQFHDVVAPVLLSRTVFSGEKSMAAQKASQGVLGAESTAGPLSWQHHWRLSLLLFSWIATIAGPDGLIASKSTGSLLLASGLAGSLDGALDDSNKIVISTLFMPSPAMALLIGASMRSEWSYKDLLADRLQIMMPLLAGMIVALLSHPSDSKKSDASISNKSLKVLSEVLTSVGGAFHRVFGGTIHTTGRRQSVKTRGEGSSDAIKAAKTYVPHMLIVSMILENHITIRSQPKAAGEKVPVLRAPSSDDLENLRKRTDSDTWIDLASTSTEDLVSEIILSVPSEDDEFDTQKLVSFLQSCQKSVMSTAAGLVSNAMGLGGAGAALPLWKGILSTLNESVVYAASESQQQGGTGASVLPKEEDAGRPGSESGAKGGSEQIAGKKIDHSPTWATTLAQNVLCRFVALVLLKSLKREQQWDVWSFEQSSAIAKLCILVEEKELLRKPSSSSTPPSFSDDQVVLICSLLDILAYGRDASGWIQLTLPSMASAGDSKSSGPGSDITANSKILLPVLHPCLRVLLSSVEYISSSAKILIPPSAKDDGGAAGEEPLLARIMAELDETLTAALVGLAFSSARNTALNAMACLRRSILSHKQAGDDGSVQLCSSLLLKVTEELRVRYESERRLRDTALFDAYDEDGSNSSGREAAQESSVIERLLLGADGVGDSNVEEVSFDSPNKKKTSDDFVLFHEAPSGDHPGGGKLGFASLQGLGTSLEEWKMSTNPESDRDTALSKVIETLTPFLDAWDAIETRDAADTELVKLFDTKAQLDSSGSGSRESLPILGSETAADAMSTFFEFAASEKTRLKEVSIRFLPSHRFSRMAFAERFCWARYMEVIASHDAESVWERAVPDGNRDIRSHLATVPCSPQFRRYLPRYLDNAPDEIDARPTEEVLEQESTPRRSSTAPVEMDAFTKTLLETGKLEIVDITKKEFADEDLPEPFESSATGFSDDDDGGNESGLFAERDSDDREEEAEINLEDAESGSEDFDLTDATSVEEEPSSSTSFHDGKSHHGITTSSFATPPDNSSSSLGLMHSAAAGMIEQHVEHCLHVKAEGNRECTVLLTSSHLILEYDGNPDGFFEGELLALQEEADRQRRLAEDTIATSKEQDQEAIIQQSDDRRNREMAALRPKSVRFNLSEVSHVYLRRYRLRESALEMFFIPTGGTSYGGFGLFSPASSLFIDFGPGHHGRTRRDEAAFALMRRAPPQAIKQWPDRSEQFLHDQLSRLTIGWAEGRITNFDYLLHLNILSGRSYNDICQYPVFPWVLGDYTSEEIPDLSDPENFRDLSKPVGALNPGRLEDFLERFNTFADPSIPPFMYGSHYSTSAGVVLHFLVRLHPFAGLHRQLQGGHFDVADRLFSSVPRTWAMCTGSSAAEVKEITPEWYCNPSFLRNANNFKLGTSQDGEVMGDVQLPPWAKGSPEKFIEVMRAALESDICSEMLPDWIDLIFGRKQQGPEAIKANNVFFYLTYYGTVDVASIEDEALRQATELQIAHFGQCPMQLFRRPHVRRLPRNYFSLSIYQLLSAYTQHRRITEKSGAEGIVGEVKSPTFDRAQMHSVFGEPLFLPFFAAPISHWVHLDAPPPGPHANLIAIRFAGTDRCLAVDAKGIFHYFRWAWRADEISQEAVAITREENFDRGCFVAQRELPRFRSVPRLMHTPDSGESVAVAISKTLFANRSVLLVLSDADGAGSLGMQLVDPAKGDIRGEVVVKQVHAAKISCIATDPIGTAAGHGGVGGELGLVGSADGNASLWRFMSSHYLPLRPRIRLQGHGGEKVVAVALASTINIAATLSSGKCCLHTTGNGTLIRSFGPPSDTIDMQGRNDMQLVTKFADTPALVVSVQGLVVTVCETTIRMKDIPDRKVVTIHLFTIEGISLGSKPLESWRGVPYKMHCTPDGTTLMVCCGRGVTMHRLSACQPLEFLDEFQITESDDFGSTTCAAWDIDLGPALNRPVVAAAACSGGVLRLHALPGISAWSERHKKSGLHHTVGKALKNPAQRLKGAVKDGLGFGRQLAGMGRDLQREVQSDVKERGVGGFLGNVMSFRKNSNNDKN